MRGKCEIYRWEAVGKATTDPARVPPSSRSLYCTRATAQVSLGRAFVEWHALEILKKVPDPNADAESLGGDAPGAPQHSTNGSRAVNRSH